MANPKAIVITGYGINCEEETAFCIEKAGAKADIVHINDLIDGHKKLDDYQIMLFPGGFSYGDDTGSGNALANKILNNVRDDMLKFAQQDKLIAGICNGFQIITNLGLLPAKDGQYGTTQTALMHNASARHECHWIHMKSTSKKCVWTKGIESLYTPVSHGEGNFYAEPEIIKHLNDNDQVIFRYTKPDGSPANQEYPHNPNGALEDIAGICDESGRIMGLMPHPERFNSFENSYNWPLEKERLIREGKELPKQGQGMQIFENAVNYFS